MKKLSILSLLVVLTKLCFAQEIELDKEKLLELYQSQRYAEAASYLSGVYPSDTKDVKALTQIAYCNMMAGKLVDAEKNYQNINELQPQQIPVLFSLSNINSRRGNKKKAIDYLQQVITIDSNNFNAYKRLADYTDSLKLKVQYLKTANQLNNLDGDVAYDLAFAYRKLEIYQPAYDALKIAIAADTANFVLQQALLPIAHQLKKYNEVVSVGEKILANDTDPKVIADVAKAHFYLNNYKKAIGYYQMLEKMEMQNEATLYFITLCYREVKNYDLAATFAKRTITEAISPNTYSYYNLLANIYEEKQQLSNASSAYKKALSYKVNKNSYYGLGLLYDLKLNQPKLALSNYNLYLKSKELNKSDQPQVDYVKARLVLLKK